MCERLFLMQSFRLVGKNTVQNPSLRGNIKLHIPLSLKNHRTTPMPYSTQLNYQSRAFKLHWQLQDRIQQPGRRGQETWNLYGRLCIWGFSYLLYYNMPNWHEGSIFISDIFLGGGGRSLPKLCNFHFFTAHRCDRFAHIPYWSGVVEGLVWKFCAAIVELLGVLIKCTVRFLLGGELSSSSPDMYFSEKSEKDHYKC